MKTYLDCIPCFIDQALRAARIATSDEQLQKKTLDRVLEELTRLPLTVTPPEIAQRVYQVVYTATGNSDPYADIKQHSNQLALSLYSSLKETVTSSADPLMTACKLAIAGNIIDFGPQGQHEDLETVITSALASSLAINDFETFKQAMQDAVQVLYLGDNAGEILFDKILIEELGFHYSAKIIYAVRERPIINDATFEDAVQVGLTDIVEVISNGSGAPATVIEQCSPKLRQLYDCSDVIIAKGQGNYESLSGQNNNNIYFFLKAKCTLVCDQLQTQLGDMILMNSTGEVN